MHFIVTVLDTLVLSNFICLPVCLSQSDSVCVCVCPAFAHDISITMGRILMRFDKNVSKKSPIYCIKISNKNKIGFVMTLLCHYFYIFSKGIESNSVQRDSTAAKGKNAAKNFGTRDSDLVFPEI